MSLRELTKASSISLACGAWPLSVQAGSHLVAKVGLQAHPGGNPGANPKSISHRCYLFEVAFVWGLTKETMHLPLGCLHQTYTTKLTKTNLDYPTYTTKPTLPNLDYQTWTTKPRKPNLHNQTCTAKPGLPNLDYKT